NSFNKRVSEHNPNDLFAATATINQNTKFRKDNAISVESYPFPCRRLEEADCTRGSCALCGRSFYVYHKYEKICQFPCGHYMCKNCAHTFILSCYREHLKWSNNVNNLDKEYVCYMVRNNKLNSDAAYALPRLVESRCPVFINANIKCNKCIFCPCMEEECIKVRTFATEHSNIDKIQKYPQKICGFNARSAEILARYRKHVRLWKNNQSLPFDLADLQPKDYDDIPIIELENTKQTNNRTQPSLLHMDNHIIDNSLYLNNNREDSMSVSKGFDDMEKLDTLHVPVQQSTHTKSVRLSFQEKRKRRLDEMEEEEVFVDPKKPNKRQKKLSESDSNPFANFQRETEEQMEQMKRFQQVQYIYYMRYVQYMQHNITQLMNLATNVSSNQLISPTTIQAVMPISFVESVNIGVSISDGVSKNIKPKINELVKGVDTSIVEQAGSINLVDEIKR
ncbi:hypothetical protein RFI_27452, partial [Reticulomyxa filosa]